MDHLTIMRTLANRRPDRQFGRYLEIGVNNDEHCFAHVPAAVKIGVDMQSGGTHRMTSDAFFASYEGDLFDMIFIDGNHHHDQALRDAKNALAVLKMDGLLMMHDCFPHDPLYETHHYCHTAWRAFAKLREEPNLDAVLMADDFGVGLVRFGRNASPIQIERSLDSLCYEDLVAHKLDWMRLVSEDAMWRWLEASHPTQNKDQNQ